MLTLLFSFRAYPVYTMGETTATMYTPAASGQYYSNQGTTNYTQVYQVPLLSLKRLTDSSIIRAKHNS
jgi:hypothetical protein